MVKDTQLIWQLTGGQYEIANSLLTLDLNDTIQLFHCSAADDPPQRGEHDPQDGDASPRIGCVVNLWWVPFHHHSSVR